MRSLLALAALLLVASTFASAEEAAKRRPQVPPCSLPDGLATALFELLPDKNALHADEDGLTVVDLGSGTGTLLAKALEVGARKVIGYEIDPQLAAASKAKLAQQFPSRSGDITVKEGDFWDADVSKADVVIVWGVDAIMSEMESKLLQQMKTGSHVLTVDARFPMKLRPIAEIQTTMKKKTFDCPAAATYTGDATFLAAYQMPTNKAPYRAFPSKPYIAVRHIDTTKDQVSAESTHVFFRRLVCSQHRRFGCLEVMAPTQGNVLKHIMVNLENYREVTGHTLKVNWLARRDGNKKEDSVLVEATLGPEYLKRHDATNIFYYYIPIHPTMTISAGDDVHLGFELNNAFQPHLHLSFAFSIPGTGWITDGLFDLVPSPRSLGTYFVASFNKKSLGVWVKRHQRMPKVHLEVIRNGHRVHSDLIDPIQMVQNLGGNPDEVPVYTAGYNNIFNHLSRDASEHLWLRATMIEPARPFVYGFQVRTWNATVREMLRAHHKRYADVNKGGETSKAVIDLSPDNQEVVTVEGINSMPDEFQAYRAVQKPAMTLRLFSKDYSTNKLGLALLFDPSKLVHKPGSSILVVLYLLGHDEFSAAWECVPATTTGATGVQEMCVFNHALPEYTTDDMLDFDVWFDVDLTAVAQKTKDGITSPKLTNEDLGARSGAGTALKRWLLRSGANLSFVDTSTLAEPTTHTLVTTKDLVRDDEIFSVPIHTKINAECVLCKHDWYQVILDGFRHTKPVVHYALEYAKLALYTLHPKDVPFNTDEFGHLIAHMDKVRELRVHHEAELAPGAGQLPMQVASLDRDPDMKAQLEEGLPYDQVALNVMGFEQRQVIVDLYNKIRKYVGPENPLDDGAALDNGKWLTSLFPDEQSFVDYVALTMKAVFPEFSVVPLLPLLKHSLTPNGAFYGNQISVFVKAHKNIAKGEAVTVGCNSYHHYMRLFKGKEIATRLAGEGRGRCVDTVLLAQAGAVIWMDPKSLQTLEAYYSGNEDQARAAINHALHWTKDAKQLEILHWALDNLFRH